MCHGYVFSDGFIFIKLEVQLFRNTVDSETKDFEFPHRCERMKET